MKILAVGHKEHNELFVRGRRWKYDYNRFKEKETFNRSEPLMIYDKDGKNYVLKETDEFEKEVKELGSSERFMKFLKERSKEKGTIPISSITKKLGI